MDLVATIWDATKCLCNCTSKHATFVCRLEENLQILTERRKHLRSLRDDMMTRVQQAEMTGRMRRSNEVENWLQNVDSMEQKIEDIQGRCDKIVQVRCLDKFCQKNCLLIYNMGKEVVKIRNDLEELIDQGQNFKNDDNILLKLPTKPVLEMPIPETVGMDSMLKMICDSIEEENVDRIGLYGMGGAGKTTLMKQFNNELAKRDHDFALVIWVVVSKDRDMDNIMDNIRRQCGIGDRDSVWNNKSKSERESEISKVMKKKKFILLLDDIWETLELHTVGVPGQNELQEEAKKSKILFTTRSENVCDQMKAKKKFKVECLREEEAFKLFCINVGEETLNSHRDIRALAQELVRECKGLPLALKIVGRVMAGRTNPKDWEHARNELQSSPAEVMENEVFFILKLSYDNLRNDTEKECFLYCALYPEDQPIYIDDLIRFWIGEGFLREHNGIHCAYNHGEHIVENLKFACLLESEENDWVKMHDVIRDMALWLARDQDQNKNKVLLQGEALELSQVNDSENRLATKRISMMYDTSIAKTIEKKNWYVPSCPHLETLIVQGKICINSFANIQHMSKLTVLSLVGIEGISTLPTEIGLLIHLKYLELSRMCINERLPIEMKNLKSLKVFLLQYVDFSLEIIPLEVISSLEKLKVFSFFQNTLMNEKSSSQTRMSYTMEESFLEQLELVPHLEDLSISLETTIGINKLLTTKLQHCVTFLGLQQGAKISISLISSMASMEHLEVIILNGLEDSMEGDYFSCIKPAFCKLRHVNIEDCHLITHLTWLKYAPILLELIVRNCNLVEEVIKESDDDKGEENIDGIFSNLMKMRLIELPKLKSIYKKALPFPMLQNVQILECPRLTDMKGKRHWWHNLKSEDPAKENLFPSKKVVFKMELHDDRVREEVLKKARKISEIERIYMDMKNSKLTVSGDFDPVDVIMMLRKLGHAEIISVGPWKMEKNIELRKMIKRSQVTGK